MREVSFLVNRRRARCLIKSFRNILLLATVLYIIVAFTGIPLVKTDQALVETLVSHGYPSSQKLHENRPITGSIGGRGKKYSFNHGYLFLREY